MSNEPTQRSHATVAAAVVGACLIAIPSVVAPNVQQRAVKLAAAGNIIDLASSLAELPSTLTGDGASALASITDALTAGGGALSTALDGALPDLGSILSVAADSAAADPVGGFLEQAYSFIDQILAAGFGILFWGVLAPGVAFFQSAWQWFANAFGFNPYPAAAEALGAGLQGVYDPEVIDAALPTGASTGLEDISSLFSGIAGMDFSALAQDLNGALDPNAITGLGTLFDPTGIADIGTLLSTSLITDIGI